MTSGWPRWAESWRGKRESGIGILLVSHSRWRTRKGIRERAWLSFVPFMVRQAHHERQPLDQHCPKSVHDEPVNSVRGEPVNSVRGESVEP